MATETVTKKIASATSKGAASSIQRSVRSIIALLQYPQFRDAIRLFVVGAAIGWSRQLLELLWGYFRRFLFAEVVVRDNDEAYRWILSFVTKDGAFTRSARDVEVRSTSNLLGHSVEYDDDGMASVVKATGKSPHFFPLPSQTFTLTFEGTRIWVSRDRALVGDTSWDETLTLSFLAPNSNEPVRRFILAARDAFKKDEEGKVVAYRVDRHCRWTHAGVISKRPAESVHLPGHIKEDFLEDARSFLETATRRWYANRGIPYRRGYLLHGVPGAGKSSLVHVLASELSLPIYTISLTSKTLDDTEFQNMFDELPNNAILLLEDIDAAFATRAVTKKTSDGETVGSRVSFSALLNALDGVGAAECRLVVMTTNHIDHLDPALIRPGRIDMMIEFKNASRTQARELFWRWYSDLQTVPLLHQRTPSGELSEKDTPGPLSATAVSQTGGSTPPSRYSKAELNDLAEQFAGTLTEDTVSVAALQGFLLRHRLSPRKAVDKLPAWLEAQKNGKGAAGELSFQLNEEEAGSGHEEEEPKSKSEDNGIGEKYDHTESEDKTVVEAEKKKSIPIAAPVIPSPGGHRAGW